MQSIDRGQDDRLSVVIAGRVFRIVDDVGQIKAPGDLVE